MSAPCCGPTRLEEQDEALDTLDAGLHMSAETLRVAVDAHPTNFDSKSVGYEFRTEPSQSGGLETTGPERGNFGSGGFVAVRSFVSEARGYWAFMRARKSQRILSRKDWRRERNWDPTVS
jgi:hypothetical protein